MISVLARQRYESERPSPEMARRDGDERFLARREGHAAEQDADEGKSA